MNWVPWLMFQSLSVFFCSSFSRLRLWVEWSWPQLQFNSFAVQKNESYQLSRKQRNNIHDIFFFTIVHLLNIINMIMGLLFFAIRFTSDQETLLLFVSTSSKRELVKNVFSNVWYAWKSSNKKVAQHDASLCDGKEKKRSNCQ